MPRALGKVAAHAKRKKWIKRAKGYWGKRGSRYKTARETVARAERYSRRDRRVKKRDFRSLWIVRINASARANGITYARLIHGLIEAKVSVNRKMLADIALNDPDTFKEFVAIAQQSTEKTA